MPRDAKVPAGHLLKRLGGVAAGIVLFYAPFALAARVTGWLLPASSAANTYGDAHSMCLRMPISWLVQPWLWGAMASNPLYLAGFVGLPLVALAAGPLFCGWLCPAGAIPHWLSKLWPRRLSFDPLGKVDVVPIRYGFFAGLLLAPFVTDSICCALCNFNIAQVLVSSAGGDFSGWTYISSTFVFVLLVWLVPLGLLWRGGRGWCATLCPVGAVQGLVSRAGWKLPFAGRVRADAGACTGCGTCESVCAMRAVRAGEGGPDIQRLLCDSCLDCVAACPGGALRYGRARP